MRKRISTHHLRSPVHDLFLDSVGVRLMLSDLGLKNDLLRLIVLDVVSVLDDDLSRLNNLLL